MRTGGFYLHLKVSEGNSPMNMIPFSIKPYNAVVTTHVVTWTSTSSKLVLFRKTCQTLNELLNPLTCRLKITKYLTFQMRNCTFWNLNKDCKVLGYQSFIAPNSYLRTNNFAAPCDSAAYSTSIERSNIWLFVA